MFQITRVIFRETVRGFAKAKSHGCEKPAVKCPKKGVQKKKGRPPAACVPGPSSPGSLPVAEGGYKIYKNIFFFICVPLIGLCIYNTFIAHPHKSERPPFVAYDHMRKRTKKFPWCGGTDKTLFHNPRVNALPDGYEDGNDE